MWGGVEGSWSAVFGGGWSWRGWSWGGEEKGEKEFDEEESGVGFVWNEYIEGFFIIISESVREREK